MASARFNYLLSFILLYDLHCLVHSFHADTESEDDVFDNFDDVPTRTSELIHSTSGSECLSSDEPQSVVAMIQMNLQMNVPKGSTHAVATPEDNNLQPNSGTAPSSLVKPLDKEVKPLDKEELWPIATLKASFMTTKSGAADVADQARAGQSGNNSNATWEQALAGVIPFTMVQEERLRFMHDAVELVNKLSIAGHLVEAGVWKGGSAAASPLQWRGYQVHDDTATIACAPNSAAITGAECEALVGVFASTSGQTPARPLQAGSGGTCGDGWGEVPLGCSIASDWTAHFKSAGESMACNTRTQYRSICGPASPPPSPLVPDCSLCAPGGCELACTESGHHGGVCFSSGSTDKGPCCSCLPFRCIQTQPPNILWFAAFSRLFDAAWVNDACHSLPTTAVVRLGYKGVRDGLNNQMMLLADALAIACEQGSSLVIDVDASSMTRVPGDAWQPGHMQPSFRPNLLQSESQNGLWSSVLDIGRMQAVLASEEGCAATRIVPLTCIAREAVSSTLCDGIVTSEDLFRKAKLSPQTPSSAARVDLQQRLWHSMPLRNDLPWIPDPRIDLNAAHYAVHFNLDVDWMLWQGHETHDLYERYKQTTNRSEAEAIASACCSNRDTDAGRWALGQVKQYADAIRSLISVSNAPVVLLTGIGKPGHTTAMWLLDALRSSLPSDAVVVTGKLEESVGSQVGAAAELSVLCRARNVVLTAGSTFSDYASTWRAVAGTYHTSLDITIGI